MMDYRKNDVTGYNSLSQTAVGNGCLYIIQKSIRQQLIHSSNVLRKWRKNVRKTA